METKKSATRKATAKKSTRNYSPSSGKEVEAEMHQGKLKSGGSGKKVTNPKQAIAIGLSEARKKGAKVPTNPNKIIGENGAARITGDRPLPVNPVTDPERNAWRFSAVAAHVIGRPRCVPPGGALWLADTRDTR